LRLVGQQLATFDGRVTARGTIVAVAQIIELAIGDTETPTRYVVEQQLDDGRVMLRPETELEQMHREHDSRPLTAEEFDELIAPHVQPPDDQP
jgi:hypothetical protein